MAKKQYRSKLEKLVKTPTKGSYEPTLEECKRWFNILNRELFKNELPPVDTIDIRWRRKAYAYYISQDDDKDPNWKRTGIYMNKRYASKKFFVEVLAHEMVHHWQFINGLPTNHGEVFQDWDAKLKKKGIKI